VPLEADSREFGARHYPVMVVLHTGLLAGCLLEVIALRRRSIGRLGWPMLAVVLAAPGGAVVVHRLAGGQWNSLDLCGCCVLKVGLD
jgi:methyltransferase